jgi:paraquat-inducible protein B
MGEQLGAPYPEIPTLPTQFEEVQMKAAKFFADLQQIDVQGLVEEIKGATAAARQLLESPDVHKAIEHLDETMDSLNSTLDSLAKTSDSARGVIDPMKKQIEPTLVELRATLAGLRTAAAGAGAVLQPDSPVIVALQKALDDAGAAAKNLRDVAEMLERQPDALLRGKPPLDGGKR